MAGKYFEELEVGSVHQHEPGRTVMESESKNQFPSIPEAEVAKMRDAAQGVYARWVEEVNALGVDGQALLDDAFALVEQHDQ